MKKVLGWVRRNLVSVISLFIALVALPALFIVGAGMKSKLHKSVEADVGKHMTDLARVKVEYALEPLTPGGTRFAASMPPNAATNERMKALLENSASQVESVRGVITEFNRNGREPLMAGLFPDPGDPISAPERLYAFARAWVNAYQDLLRSVNAGSPPEEETVIRKLDEIRLREEETRLGGRADAKLSEQDVAEIRSRLSEERLQTYMSRAASIRFYADPSIFTGVAPWTEPVAPTVEQAFEWQWRLWVHQDLINAFALANDGESALTGAIKRIERIEIDPIDYARAASQQGSEDPTAEAPIDYNASITGRVAWPAAANGLYDIRYATVEMLVDSARIFEIFNAVSSTNLMTVIDLDMVSVDDLASQMQRGYVYTQGGERIMRATVRIETIWLRSWTQPLMPPRIQAALGVPGAAMGDAGPDGAAPTGRPQNERPARGPGPRLR